jgi:hypothetical protein
MPQEDVEKILLALPKSTAGNVIRAVYITGKRLRTLLSDGDIKIFYNTEYLRQVYATTARTVNVAPGYGIDGLRIAGVLRKLRRATTDDAREKIRQESEVSAQQFQKYLTASQQSVSSSV